MKNFSKKRTGIVTLLIMCAALFGFGTVASADDVEVLSTGEWGDTITYTLTSDGVLTISGYGEMYDSKKPVSDAGYEDFVETIVFESDTSLLRPGITYIGKNVFSSYEALTSITFPSTLETIGGSAFYQCEALTSVTLPEGLKTIDYAAFDQCRALETVSFPSTLETIGSSAFSYCPLITVTLPESLKTIDGSAFSHNPSLISVSFPAGLETIGKQAFYYCTALTDINFAAGPTVIDDHAFQGCSSLTRIVIPEGTTTIGNYCFSKCSNLTSVSLPDSIVSLGYSVFGDTNWLSKQANGAVYASNVFYCYKGDCPETVVIKDGTVCIAGNAFQNITTLKNVIIPDTVKGVCHGAFDGCTSLSYVKMSENTENVETYAFATCSSLTGLRIVGDMTTLGDYAFTKCTSLETVVLPDTLNYIDKGAFDNCPSLSDVYFEGSSYDWDLVYIYDYANDYLINDTTVHCNNTDPDITALAVSDASAVLDIGDTQYIAAIPTSAAAKNTAVWTSSDTSVATVEDGCITAVSAGSAVITASIGSLTAQCDVYVTEPDDEEVYPYTILATAIKTAGGVECEAIPNGAFYAEVTVSETTERESCDYFVAAAYSSDGALVDIKYIYTNVCDEPLSVGFYFSNAAYVKFFVWDALGTMSPLAETAQII